MVSPARSICFITLGCKVNQYDSETMAESLRREGWLVVDRPADLPGAGLGVIVVNSCTVTARAAAKSRQTARAAVRRYPGAHVIMAGCHPQVFRAEASLVEGLAGIAGTGRGATLTLIRSLAANARDIASGSGDHADTPVPCAGMDFAASFELLPAAPVHGRVRAFLKVQEGCDMRCAYCIVPDTRGPQRSATLAEAVTAAQDLLAQGAREIVLTGIHLGAFGTDRGAPELPQLVHRLLRLPGLLRLRLSSIEPTDVSDDLLAVLAADHRACRHLHIPLQSGSAGVLRRMGRRYAPADYLAMVDRAREALPGLALSTDVLTGLPGETATDVAATEEILRAVGFMRLHVFPYSPRPGTPAAAMPGQVPAAERNARAHYLATVGKALAAAHCERMVGRESEALLERPPNILPVTAAGNARQYGNEGLTPDYVRVITQGSISDPAGQLVRVQVLAATEDGVTGLVTGRVEAAGA